MQIVVIAHNVRSTHNIGSVFRTCDGLGVYKLYLTGYSAYPSVANDSRLQHIAEKLTRQIHKTALGAERTVPFEHASDVRQLIAELKEQGYHIAALEQAPSSVPLDTFLSTVNLPRKLALIIGNEVNGVEDCLDKADMIIEIPMHGKKESFNVSVATGIALYELSKAR